MPAPSRSTRRGPDVAEQRAGRRVVQRRGRDLLEARAVPGGVEQTGWRPRTAQGEDEQVRGLGRAAEQVQDQLERGVVGPLDVVEEQYKWAEAGSIAAR